MQSDLHVFYNFMHLLGMEPMTFALLETLSVVMQRNALHEADQFRDVFCMQYTQDGQ